MSILLSIFLGGGVGALLRFLISEQTDRLFLSSFPFGTIVVNVLGAFLMGLVVSYFAAVSYTHLTLPTILLV